MCDQTEKWILCGILKTYVFRLTLYGLFPVLCFSNDGQKFSFINTVHFCCYFLAMH